jgi:excisionase family DNA binding protein
MRTHHAAHSLQTTTPAISIPGQSCIPHSAGFPNQEALRSERLGYSPAEAAAVLGVGLTFFYEQMGSGRIRALKAGRRTIIPAASLTQFLETLPAAVITTGRRRAP